MPLGSTWRRTHCGESPRMLSTAHFKACWLFLSLSMAITVIMPLSSLLADMLKTCYARNLYNLLHKLTMILINLSFTYKNQNQLCFVIFLMALQLLRRNKRTMKKQIRFYYCESRSLSWFCILANFGGFFFLNDSTVL